MPRICPAGQQIVCQSGHFRDCAHRSVTSVHGKSGRLISQQQEATKKPRHCYAGAFIFSSRELSRDYFTDWMFALVPELLPERS
jgi:hypothetical protein